ncbi:DegT/DnrJ/EryC1/StrS family aminotransferase, partial [Gemmiger formicilis]|uniref:DegT/DnrJ/EryC1/StrS family aminotransferase n=1 Tax=Gemmiger formicilis TaxID=745368 RepID=UPI001FAFDC01
VTVPQYNIDVTKLEAALSPKTKAVMIAHTLGNPFDLAANSMKVLNSSAEPWKVTVVDTGLDTMTGGRVKR